MEGGGNRLDLTTEAIPLFKEGIGLVLSRWSALQLHPQAMSDEEEDDEDDDDGADVGNGRDGMSNDDIMVDAIQQPRNVNQPNQVATAEAEDGWVQVTSRRSRGTRN